MARQLESMTDEQLQARLSSAYKKFMEIEDKRLIVMDIAAFSQIMDYRVTTISKEELFILEGRRQMAMHILRHLDMTPIDLIESHNDALILNSTTSNDGDN